MGDPLRRYAEVRHLDPTMSDAAVWERVQHDRDINAVELTMAVRRDSDPDKHRRRALEIWLHKTHGFAYSYS